MKGTHQGHPGQQYDGSATVDCAAAPASARGTHGKLVVICGGLKCPACVIVVPMSTCGGADDGGHENRPSQYARSTSNPTTATSRANQTAMNVSIPQTPTFNAAINAARSTISAVTVFPANPVDTFTSPFFRCTTLTQPLPDWPWMMFGARGMGYAAVCVGRASISESTCSIELTDFHFTQNGRGFFSLCFQREKDVG